MNVEWISIKEGQPSNDKSVLGFYNSCYVGMVHYIDGEFYKMWSDNTEPLFITHWTLLPESPKDK